MVNVLTIVLFLVLGMNELNTGLDLETLRSACPYSDFCTTGSLRKFKPSNDTQPCCFDCFCDRFSVAFGDSCPDYFHNSTHRDIPKNQLECKPLFFENRFALSKNNTKRKTSMHHFRYIDFCPSDYHGDLNTRDKCTGNYVTKPRYDDIVAVSNKDSVLFKNRHCARCHGEINVNRWNIKVLRCNDNLEEIQLSASDMEDYIIKNCLLTSSRPSELPMNSRTLDCRDKLLCDESQANQKTAEACLNGTRMPFMYLNVFGFYQFYKNVFCANCERKSSEICPKSDQNDPRSVEFLNLEVLLNLVPTKASPTTLCSDYELYDHRKGECRRVFCPPLEVSTQGECIPISIQSTNLNLNVKILYTADSTEDLSFLTGIREAYNIPKAKFYHSILKKEFQIPSCEITEMIATAVFKKELKKFLFISLDLVYKVNENCTLRYLGDGMRKIDIKKRKWALEGSFFKLKGQVTVFDMTRDSFTRDTIHYGLFAFYAGGPYIVRKFFLCPYVLFTLDELKNDLKTQTNLLSQNLMDVEKLKPTFFVQNGIYPLSEAEIAVCVDTYLARNAATIKTMDTLSLMAFHGFICFVQIFWE